MRYVSLSEQHITDVIIGVFLILVSIDLLLTIWSIFFDGYQCYRYNDGVCKKCNKKLIMFHDLCAPKHYGFECNQCRYITYVSKDNMFIDLSEFENGDKYTFRL